MTDNFQAALALHLAGRLDEAVAAYGLSLSVAPDRAAAWNNMGLALRGLGRAVEAEAACRRAMDLDPGHSGARNNLGLALADQGRLDEARQSHLDAIALNPANAEAHANLGDVLRLGGRLDESAQACRRALELRPDFPEAANNLGNALLAVGEIDQAIGWFQRAVQLRPDYADAWRNLLLALLYRPGLDQEAVFAAHRRFEEAFAPAVPALKPEAGEDPDRVLRIGYLSSDFRAHSVARNLLPTLRLLDRERFHVHCYAELARPDAVTAEFQSLARVWRPIAGLGDSEAAELIRRDGIDILVCLAGHFDRNRPLICAFRPAPIQISYFDAATSGLGAMDYLFSDPVMTPRGGPERFTERLLRLPHFYVGEIPPDLPVSARKAGEPLTFACLNNPAKLSDAVLDLWAEILARVPGSRLLLKYFDWMRTPSLRRRIEAALARRGIAPDRLLLPSEADLPGGHFGVYDHIDIALDPFPFSGSTSTFEALIMGVPVVSLAGATLMSRWSAAMLRALDLERHVADTPQAYVDIAVALAANGDERAELRATLRDRVAASPLCDARRKVRQIERFYRAVWKRWLRGGGP